LLQGAIYSGELLSIISIYYHSGIPLESAKAYFNTLNNNLKGTFNRLPIKKVRGLTPKKMTIEEIDNDNS